MLITKFNKMIKSKILLILLAFIIVLAFVAVPVATQLMKNKNPGGGGAEGELNGDDISKGEFLRARYYELRLRRDTSLTPEEDAYLRNRVWMRLAALKQAKAIGITVANDEIAAYLQRDQAFLVAGNFNSDKYRDILMRMRIAESDYEDYMRQELLLRKLIDVLASTFWVPHNEASDRAGSLMDYFIAEYIHMSLSNTVTKVKVSDADIKEYYETNKEYFKTEKKINVRYIQFPVDEHIDAIEITSEAVEDYYAFNIDDYTTTDTNNVSVPTPLKEVKDGIAHQLKLKKALNDAAVKASDLVSAMVPGRYSDRKGASMEQAAQTFKMKVQTSEFFAASESVQGIDADLMFNRIAFSLDPDDDEGYFSDAIFGESNIYVIATQDTIEPAIPEFDEIKNRIIPAVKQELEIKKFYEKAASTRDTLIKGLDDGKKLKDLAKRMKLKVETTKPFNVYEGSISNDIAYADTLIPTVMKLNGDELSDVVDTEDGILLVRIVERTPADALSIMAMKPQVLAMIERYRTSLVYDDWLNANLASAGLVDHIARLREELGPLDDDKENDAEPETQN